MSKLIDALRQELHVFEDNLEKYRDAGGTDTNYHDGKIYGLQRAIALAVEAALKAGRKPSDEDDATTAGIYKVRMRDAHGRKLGNTLVMERSAQGAAEAASDYTGESLGEDNAFPATFHVSLLHGPEPGEETGIVAEMVQTPEVFGFVGGKLERLRNGLEGA